MLRNMILIVLLVSVQILSYCSQAWLQTCYVVELTFEHFLKFTFILVYMSGCFACMIVCAPCMCLMLKEARRGRQILWSYRQVWATMWELGIKAWSSVRASALKHWAIFPAPGLEHLILWLLLPKCWVYKDVCDFWVERVFSIQSSRNTVLDCLELYLFRFPFYKNIIKVDCALRLRKESPRFGPS